MTTVLDAKTGINQENWNINSQSSFRLSFKIVGALRTQLLQHFYKIMTCVTSCLKRASSSSQWHSPPRIYISFGNFQSWDLCRIAIEWGYHGGIAPTKHYLMTNDLLLSRWNKHGVGEAEFCINNKLVASIDNCLTAPTIFYFLWGLPTC